MRDLEEGPQKFKKPEEKTDYKYAYELTISGHTYKIETNKMPKKMQFSSPSQFGRTISELVRNGRVFEEFGGAWKPINPATMQRELRRELAAVDLGHKEKPDVEFKKIHKEKPDVKFKKINF